MVDISIIVAFDNNAPLMCNYIEEVLPFIEGREDRELVLAADRCLDIETLEFARKCDDRWDNVHLYELGDKVGYSRANNYAVEHSNGRYLLFMNTDIFAEPGSIEALRTEFDADPKLGAAQGRLLYPQSGKVMSTGHCFGDYMNHHLYQGRDGDDAIVMRRAYRQALNSAFLMMPAEVYAEFGGMDEFFYNAYDGMDLTLRVGMGGYRLLYVPEALAWHSTGGSRDYIKHNNEYQSKYFYCGTGAKIENDLKDYLAEQIDTDMVARDYLVVDCTFNKTWNKMLSDLGFNITDVVDIREKDSSRVDLYRNLPPEVHFDERPLLFVVNHFGDVSANKRWFEKRGNFHDVIIDFFGNVMRVFHGNVMADFRIG